MTYTHLTTDELVMIESYHYQNTPVVKIAVYLNRIRTAIYTVINFLKDGDTMLNYYQQYKENKKRCGRHKIVLSEKQQYYIKKSCSRLDAKRYYRSGGKAYSLFCAYSYRQFKEKIFDEITLPIKGKRKPNGH